MTSYVTSPDLYFQLCRDYLQFFIVINFSKEINSIELKREFEMNIDPGKDFGPSTFLKQY